MRIPVKKCQRGIRSIKCKAIAMTPGMEHYCFVVYAGVEVLHLPATFWWVNLALLVTGGSAIIYEKFLKEEE